MTKIWGFLSRVIAGEHLCAAVVRASEMSRRKDNEVDMLGYVERDRRLLIYKTSRKERTSLLWQTP